MRILTRSARRAGVTLAVSALALTSAACGSKSSTSGTGAGNTTTPATTTTSTGTGSSPSAPAGPGIVVPDKIKKAGVIKIATDASYPPIESVPSGKTIVGLDPDLGAALGKVLGVKVMFVNADFDGIVAGVASGRYDMAMSAMTDNAKREKTVDFVDYYSSGTSFMIKKGGPTINTIADICGLKVAVEKGTTQLEDATNQSKKCAKKATILGFDKQDQANAALTSGRAQVVMADSPVNAYAALKSNGAFVISGQIYGTAPYGIAIPKKSTQLRDAVSAALTQLIANGKYKAVLSHWGVQAGAITKVAINGGAAG